jgi:hypothetical protein
VEAMEAWGVSKILLTTTIDAAGGVVQLVGAVGEYETRDHVSVTHPRLEMFELEESCQSLDFPRPRTSVP